MVFYAICVVGHFKLPFSVKPLRDSSLGLRGLLDKKRTARACRSVESGGLTTLPPDHCYQKLAGAFILAILVPSSAIFDGGVPGWPIQLHGIV